MVKGRVCESGWRMSGVDRVYERWRSDRMVWSVALGSVWWSE